MGDVVSAVLAALGPVVGDVDNLVLTPLLEALGVSIGNADVSTLALDCGVAPPPVTTHDDGAAPATVYDDDPPPTGRCAQPHRLRPDRLSCLRR